MCTYHRCILWAQEGLSINQTVFNMNTKYNHYFLWFPLSASFADWIFFHNVSYFKKHKLNRYFPPSRFKKHLQMQPASIVILPYTFSPKIRSSQKQNILDKDDLLNETTIVIVKFSNYTAIMYRYLRVFWMSCEEIAFTGNIEERNCFVSFWENCHRFI